MVTLSPDESGSCILDDTSSHRDNMVAILEVLFSQDTSHTHTRPCVEDSKGKLPFFSKASFSSMLNAFTNQMGTLSKFLKRKPWASSDTSIVDVKTWLQVDTAPACHLQLAGSRLGAQAPPLIS